MITDAPHGAGTHRHVSSRRQSLRRILGGVLGVSFLGFPAQAAQEGSPASLVFCAYNVKNWLQMDRFDGSSMIKDAGKPEAEKAAVIANLKNIAPDVLGLSEIGTAKDLSEIQALLKDAGLDLPHSEIAQGGDPTRRLGLLSRFPIKSRQSLTDLTYKLDGQIIPVQRGFLDVTLQPIPNLDLRFIGVHFKSMREIPEADQALMRRHESSLLRKHIDAILADTPNAALLVYGDFNEHRHEPPIKIIHGSRTSYEYLEDIRVLDKQGHTWTHFWEAADSYSRLDYFFATRTMKRLIDLDHSYIFDSASFSQASDHRPIVTTIRLQVSTP